MKIPTTILLLSFINMNSCTKIFFNESTSKNDQALLQTLVSDIHIHEFENNTLRMNLTFNNLVDEELRLYGIIEPWEKAIFHSCFRFDVLEGDIEINPFFSKVNYMPDKSSYLLLAPKSQKKIELAFEIVRAKKGRARLAMRSIYNEELRAEFDIVIDEDFGHTKSFY